MINDIAYCKTGRSSTLKTVCSAGLILTLVVAVLFLLSCCLSIDADGHVSIGLFGPDRMTALAMGPVTNVNTGENFPTIQAAISDADTVNGHTILVFSGTYNERVVVTKSVGIKGDDANTVLSGPPGSNVGFEIQAGYVNLSHFTINRNSGDAGSVINVAGDHCNISQVVIDGAGGGLVRGISIYNDNDYNTVLACTLNNMGTGIYIGGAPIPRHNDVGHNVITGCTHGIWLSYAYGTRIWANDIRSGYYGIQAEFSEDGLIYTNMIDGQATAGLYLYNSYNNNVIKNHVSGSAAGIYVALTPPATPNTIYFNYFTSNTDNCVYVPNPSADAFSGVASYNYAGNNYISRNVGNYWSDFSGTDGDGDGIGDTPYTNDAMVDNYPLISDTIIAIPDAPPVQNVDTGESFWTIQEAIADTDTLAGHVIEAGSGTYYGIVNIDKAGLTVRGKDTGDGRPIMDALTPGTGATGFLLNADGVVLEAFDVFQAPNWPAGANLVEVNGDGCTVRNMYMDGMGTAGNYNNFGIVVNGDGTTITGNTVAQCFDGIWIKGSDNIVYLNDVNYNGVNNIFVGPNSNNNILDNNNVNGARANAGIAVQDGSSNNRITGNTAIGNKQWGIQLASARDNFVFLNTLWCNPIGIELGNHVGFGYSTGNRIQDNYARLNDYNVYVFSGNGGNYFWLNDFSDANINTAFSGDPGNVWYSPWEYIYTSWTNNNEYQSAIGNKWHSDYTGEDADGDAIGDTPYNPVPYLSDNHPITSWVDIWEVYLGVTSIAITGGEPQTCRATIYKNYIGYTGADVDITLQSTDSSRLSFPGGAGTLTQTVDNGGNVMTTVMASSDGAPGGVELSASVFGYQAQLIDGFGGVIGDTKYINVDHPAGWKFRSGLNGSGIYDDGGIRPTNSLLWSFSDTWVSEASPAIVNGVVYTTTNQGVYALDAVTGIKLWDYYILGANGFTSPAVSNGVVYVGSNNRNVYALDASDGDVIWSFPTGGTVLSSPVVSNGIVYTASWENGVVYALNAATGALMGSYSTGNLIQSSPVVYNGFVYIGDSGGNLLMLGQGLSSVLELKGSFPIYSDIRSTPAIVNGVAYFGCEHNYVYALDTATGELKWTYATGNDVSSSPAVANGVVYIGSDDDKVYALDANTGAELWTFTTGGDVYSSPAVANGRVYVGSADNNLYVLDAATGDMLWSYTTGAGVYSSPSVANGVVYFGSDDGTVYALGTGIPPVADFTGTSLSGLAPLRPLFLDASTGSVAAWEWDFGDGTPASTEQNPQHWYMNPGVYTVTLTVTGPGGSDSESKTGYVVVLPGKTYGGTASDSARSVIEVSDGYLLAGATSSMGAGSNDMYLVKTDRMGNKVWERTYGGTGSDVAYSVAAVSDGYVVAGYTFSFGAGGADMFLVKTDLDGIEKWHRTYGGTDTDRCAFVAAISGGYILAGDTRSSGAGSYDMYVVKTNEAGDPAWARTYGGAGVDSAQSLISVSDGYVVAGYTESYGAGSRDVYLVKIFADGDQDWAKTFGGARADSGSSIIGVSDGYVIAGHTESFGYGTLNIPDVYLLKTKVNGDLVWQKTFGGAELEYGLEVAVVGDGYVVSGQSNSFGSGAGDLYVVKTDRSGNLGWEKTFGGSGSDYYGTFTVASQGLAIAGITKSEGSAGEDDAYLILTDFDGNPRYWHQAFGSTGTDVFYETVAVSDGYVSVGQVYSAQNSSQDVYIVKTDANGNMVWAKSIDKFNTPYSDQYGYGIVAVIDGYVISGVCRNSGDSSWDAYWMKVDLNGDFVWERQYSEELLMEETGDSIAVAGDGGFIITGYAKPSGSKKEVYLIKTDSNGIRQWSKRFSGLNDEMGNNVIAVSDGYVIVGGTAEWNNPASDVLLLKTFLNGTLWWQQTYGNAYYDWGYWIAATSDGGYIVAGATKLAAGSTTFDAILVKTGSDGAQQWVKTYGGSNDDVFYSVALATDGYILSGGTASSGAGSVDAWLMKTDLSGAEQWQKTYGGSAYDEAWSVVPVSDGYVMAGWTQSYGAGGWDAYVIKVNEQDLPLALINMFYDKVSMPEGKASFQISIVRSDILDTICSVTYSTQDGSATAGIDYLAQVKTITFSPGDTSKVIRVLIIDDKLKEGAETFTVRLTGASGATVGAKVSTTCEIRASDPLGV